MNKIEIQYIIVLPTCPCKLIAFEMVLIFAFYSRIQKRKVLKLSNTVEYIYIYIYIYIYRYRYIDIDIDIYRYIDI